MSENQIQSDILQALKQVGIHAMRVNSGRVKVAGGWLTLAPEGTADILVFPRMRLPYWLEIKAEKGRQSPAQKDFEESVRSLGHGYRIVKSLDDLMPLLGELR